MKRVYGQSWPKTVLKTALALFLYILMIMPGFLLLALMTLVSV